MHTGGEKSTWEQGIEYVVKQFKGALQEMGVTEIETSESTFNHDEMEAVSEELTAEASLDGQVAKQVTCGYRLNNKVIKAARVVVYKFQDLPAS